MHLEAIGRPLALALTLTRHFDGRLLEHFYYVSMLIGYADNLLHRKGQLNFINLYELRFLVVYNAKCYRMSLII